MSRIVYNALPTLSRFHKSDAFIRGVLGPVGSGKSAAMCACMLSRGIKQKTWQDTNIRKSSWGIVRNTFDMLNRTTLRTFMDWMPNEFLVVKGHAPIEATLKLPLPDGTIAEMHFDFISCNQPKDINKLKSFEITGLWLNEASELPKVILDWGSTRVGRYPAKKDGGASWSGVIMDTNAMDTDHWYYYLAEKDYSTERGKRIAAEIESAEQVLRNEGLLLPGQSSMEFFRQPSALVFKNGLWVPNRGLAENIENLDGGWAYYLKGVIGKSYDQINIQYGANYGSALDGKLVYPEYSDNEHYVPDILVPDSSLPVTIGLDWGIATSAASIAQFTLNGQLRVLGELATQELGTRQFLHDALKPYLLNNFNGATFKVIGDPNKQRSQANSDFTCGGEVRDAGFDYADAKTQDPIARREAVAYFLNRRDGFKMGINCVIHRKGFVGGYHYKRIQVTGDERYRDVPDKNHPYSDVHDGLQYVALEHGSLGAIRAKRSMRRSFEDWPESGIDNFLTR